MANRYDRAAEAPILNTYVPINFDQLYRVGAAQREAVDKAAQDLSTNVQKFGEFYSPSAIDTQRFYDASIGQVKDLITEAASNPDALKDANFRSRLNSRIANLDYSTLSNLRQSREGMLARQKANQELMMRGMYNPLWHDVDFTNYDTSAAGTFNDVAPLAYKSEVDLVKPYVDNLKSEFIGMQNGWIRTGVSTERTDAELMQGLSSIQNTPEYAKHLEVLQRQGMSPEQAEQYLNQRLITAGREFAYENRERDPWYIKSMELQARYGGRDQASLNNLTTLVHRDARRKILENFSGLNPTQIDQVLSGDLTGVDGKTLKIVNNNLDSNNIRRLLSNSFNEVYKQSGNNIDAGINYILDVMSTPLSDSAADAYASLGTTKKIGEGTYQAQDSRNFVLADDIALSMTGDNRILKHIEETPGKGERGVPKSAKGTIARAKFVKDWKSGNKFHDFIIEGDTKAVTNGNQVYQIKYAYIPKDQFNKSDYPDDESIRLAGGQVVTLGDMQMSNTIRRESEEGEPVSISTNVRDKSKEYVRVKIGSRIPSRGEAAITSDARYSKKTRGLRGETIDTQNILSEQERMN